MILSIIQERQKDFLKSEQELVKVTYNTVIEAFRIHSNLIYFNRVNTKVIKDILKDVNNSSAEEKTVIRKKLYNELIDMYDNMGEYKLKQLHFHLPNNDSFLRFHRVNKYGDNLSKIRDTVAYVNKYHRSIHGFEEGRIFNGYRFVYPLQYKGKYLGSVETSVSMETIINEFKKEMDADIDFIIKKSVVDKKVFKDEKKNYHVCNITPNYYHEKSISLVKTQFISHVINSYAKKHNIEKYLKRGEIFNFHSDVEGKEYVVTYLPIRNAVSKDTVGYLIIVKRDDEFHSAESQYFLFLAILIFLSGISIYVIYHIDATKSKLIHKDVILNEVQKIGRLGYWELDLIKNELIWSDEVYNILNISKQKFENTYEGFLKYIHPEDIEKVNNEYKNSVKEKRNYYIEHRIITSSGEIKYVEEECHHSFDSEGNILQSLGTIRDISHIKLYQQEILKAKKQFESLVTHIPDIIYRCEIDEDLTTLFINNAIEILTGYKESDLKLNRVISFSSLIVAEDREFVLNTIKELAKNKEGKKHTKIEYRVITKENKTIWVNNFIEIIHEDGYKFVEGIMSDITAQKEAYSKLQKFVDTQDNIVILSDGDKINFANKKFFDFLNFETLENFQEKHDCICEFFIDNDRFFHLGKVQKGENWIEVLENLSHAQRVVTMMGQDFNIHAFSVTVNSFEKNLKIVSFTDISQTMLEHIKLEEKTIHDKLTGAYNREYFDQNYKVLLEKFNNGYYNLAIAILDIDHFKTVNDSYGHDIGDIVLKDMVGEISKFSRSEDILIRWGGEEFIMILKVESDNGLYKALDHIRNIIEQHYFEEVKKITCSFGATIYKDNEPIDETIKRADNALYKAKRNGRNQVVIY